MRLDMLVYKRGLAESRSRARVLIEAGSVAVNGIVTVKPAHDCAPDDAVELAGRPLEYVSRGGYKLAAALDGFGIRVDGLVAADIGASTGGFTDCLLSRGAAKVYAVDSGSAQLAEKLRNDPRVVSLEGVNARTLTADLLGELCDIIVMDVSFISQTKLYGGAAAVIKDGGMFISLIKPQFEAGREHVGKGGIVRDGKARLAAVGAVVESASLAGFEHRGTLASPVAGGDGNIEYLAHFIYHEKLRLPRETPVDATDVE